MNVYYNIDDLDLSDGPVIVNMIIERANGQQIVSSLAPDAVVEEFDIQSLVDSAEVEELRVDLEDEVKQLRMYVKAEVERLREDVKALLDQLEECTRVRDKHYHNWKIAKEAYVTVFEERDELRVKLEAAEKALRGES